jgi:DNA-binding FrmR family transcriptional regulator
MGLEEATKRNLRTRLNRVRGQVDGILRMIEDERYCPEIMQQFAAVHAGLRSVEKKLMENHLDRCASRAMAEGGDAAAQVRQEIVDLFYRYGR